MPATVVYIHGNGNKASATSLKDQWDRALFGANLGDRSRMAYWASVRYPAPLPDAVFDEIEHPGESVEEGLPDVVVEDPASVDPKALAVEARTEAREAAVDGSESVPAPAVGSAGLEVWLRRMAYTADALVAGEVCGPDGAEVLPLPRSARIALFRALVKVTFRDVYAYFFTEDGERMRQVLRMTLHEAPDPVIVVSHSLGTIIAYDVLRESAITHRKVPLFLTVGSPLGTTEVQDLIVNPLKVPAGVAAWRNVADARDLVALDPTLRPEYPPEARCLDFLVTNDSDNHHGIREYLSTGAVQDAVRPLVG